MLDYHVHLWPHDEPADLGELSLERLERYVERASERGVAELAVTEHLFRFSEAKPLLDRYVASTGDERLGRHLSSYFAAHETTSLERYVEALITAKDAGLPLRIGLEVDHYEGLAEEVRRLLAGYPFDVLLCSVHFLGAWTFDYLEDETSMREWTSRSLESIWARYARAFAQLAETGVCDVAAHLDLVKLTGAVADRGVVEEVEARLCEAVCSAGLVVEVSSAGRRKPVGEPYPSTRLLERLFDAGASITLASDTHGAGLVGDGVNALVETVHRVGFRSVVAFDGRRRRELELERTLPASSGRR